MNEYISIIIPVYNEEKSVRKVLNEIKLEFDKLSFRYEFIVIDDGSQDESFAVLEEIEYVTLLKNPYNIGYGASLKRGLEKARGDWVMIMDSDSTYPAEKIPELLTYINRYDMVVGDRGAQEDVLGKKLAKWILKKIAGFLVGIKIPDLNSGMRVFRKKHAMEFFGLYPAGFSFTTTITMAFLVNSYTLKYIPISYHERVGSSKIRPKHFFDFVTLIVRLMVFFKPLKMFSVVAAVFFTLGAAKAVKDIVVGGAIGNLAVLLILFSVQVLLMAFIAEIIIRKRSL